MCYAFHLRLHIQKHTSFLCFSYFPLFTLSTSNLTHACAVEITHFNEMHLDAMMWCFFLLRSVVFLLSRPPPPSPHLQPPFFFLAGGKVIMTVMTGMLCKDGIAGCWVRGKGSKVFCAGCVVWKALHLTSCYFYRPLQTCLSNLHCLSFNLKVRNYCSLVAVQKNKNINPKYACWRI